MLTRSPLLRTCLLAVCFLLPVLGQSHAPDQSYLYLSLFKDNVRGRVEMNARDINRALGLNLPDDLSMADVTANLPAIQRYIRERVSITGPEEYRFAFLEPEILKLAEMDQDVVRFHFDLDGMTYRPETLDITYNILFDEYDRHRGALIIDQNWKEGVVSNETSITDIFEPGRTTSQLDLTGGSVWQGFVALVRLGMYHIWIGLDHILFVVALILPSVVRRRRRAGAVSGEKQWEWVPVESFKDALLYILKIVTSFTIAHSITLALASLKIVELPSRPVEAIIAFSIALAAFHNIRPIFRAKEWIIAFVFGLFHGFGFASVLGEKGLSGDYMAYSLLGFNLGVEIGQVAIVLAVFPLLYLIRKWRYYPQFITWGSVALIILSMQWVVERAFDFNVRYFDIVKSLFANG